MCVGPADLDRLFLYSLRSCVQRVADVDKVVIVTPCREQLLARLTSAGPLSVPIEVIEDCEALPRAYASLPGWCKQQAIKLHGDHLTGQAPFICLGADTVVLRSIELPDLFEGNTPILYYNRYHFDCAHLSYERKRVDAVARVLRVEPVRAREFGDFIMDLTVLDPAVLTGLRAYLEQLYGQDALTKVMPRTPENLAQKQTFGEWTLYAVFLLDVLGMEVPIRNSNSLHLAQVHSHRELERFGFDAKIVHFVSKAFNMSELASKFQSLGVGIGSGEP